MGSARTAVLVDEFVPELAAQFVLPRHALHAARLTFPHPGGGSVTAEAALPAELAALVIE